MKSAVADAAKGSRTRATGSFAARFGLALGGGLAAAVVLAPVAAAILAAVGWRFPFPRIFDRTVMFTLLAALLLNARQLRFGALLRAGFGAPGANVARAAAGFALAAAAMAALFALARASGGGAAAGVGALGARALRFVVPALAIGLIEEGFFRAFLLGGLRDEWGARGALAASSGFYAVAHLVRSPKHYYLAGFHAAAGLENLGASAAQLGHPVAAAPMLIGLFLLGVVLGEAFLLTGRVWFSVGLHAGLVVGAKTWPLIGNGGAPVSRLIAGGGPVPLIAAPAAWLIALGLMLLLPKLLGHEGAAGTGRRGYLDFGG